MLISEALLKLEAQDAGMKKDRERFEKELNSFVQFLVDQIKKRRAVSKEIQVYPECGEKALSPWQVKIRIQRTADDKFRFSLNDTMELFGLEKIEYAWGEKDEVD